MSEISYSEYFYHLNSDVNNLAGIISVLNNILSKEDIHRGSIEFARDIVEVRYKTILNELKEVSSLLSEQDVETGLSVVEVGR